MEKGQDRESREVYGRIKVFKLLIFDLKNIYEGLNFVTTQVELQNTLRKL